MREKRRKERELDAVEKEFMLSYLCTGRSPLIGFGCLTYSFFDNAYVRFIVLMLLLSMLFYILNTCTLHIDFLSLAIYVQQNHTILSSSFPTIHLFPPYCNASTNQVNVPLTCLASASVISLGTPTRNFK